MLRRSLCLLLLCFSPTAFAGDHDHSDHVSTLFDLRVVHAWTRAGDGETAYVFGEIENQGSSDVRLLGASSSIGNKASLAGFRLGADGKGTYLDIGTLPVRAGSTLVLQPEGAAIRLEGMAKPRAKGDAFDIKLRFDVGEVTVHVAVESADATAHSHAGHAH